VAWNPIGKRRLKWGKADALKAHRFLHFTPKRPKVWKVAPLATNSSVELAVCLGEVQHKFSIAVGAQQNGHGIRA
jgi:hypothetical protein